MMAAGRDAFWDMAGDHYPIAFDPTELLNHIFNAMHEAEDIQERAVAPPPENAA